MNDRATPNADEAYAAINRLAELGVIDDEQFAELSEKVAAMEGDDEAE